ncbi:hypothetical protein D5281_13470 [bacterium 1xD42-62]|uniref:Uncharacterized protein n=1 Tax=Parablautia muri TaxID=2320879 RepID=A0A9X5BGE8_9FIRM|nr:hypothetical protein [Parablautia muri]
MAEVYRFRTPLPRWTYTGAIFFLFGLEKEYVGVFLHSLPFSDDLLTVVFFRITIEQPYEIVL